MKKILSFIIAFSILALNTAFATCVSAQNEIRIIVNGKEIYSDQPPVIRDNRVFAPIRAIAESLGANVEFSDDSYYRKVYISDDKHTSEFNFSNAFCEIDGLELAMDTIPFIENSRTLLPVRVVSQALGCKVSWDGDTRTVNVQKTVNDESGFNGMKLYPDKPLVYDAVSDTSVYYYSPHYADKLTYIVPAINIGKEGAKTLSDKIYNIYDGYLKENEDGELFFGCYYSHYLNNGILSIVFYSIWDWWDVYDVFNYDIESGKELTNTELLSRCGIDEQQLTSAVRNSCTAHIRANYETYRIFQPSSAWGVNTGLFDLSYPIFIDSNGYIRAVMGAYTDDDGQFTIDSGINIY